jgi:hypothetical protein
VESDRAQASAISQQILDELTLYAELEEQIIYPLLKEQDAATFYEAQRSTMWPRCSSVN